MTALVERHGSTAPGRSPPGPPRFTAMVVVASPFVRETLARTLRALGRGRGRRGRHRSPRRAPARRGTTARDLAVVDSSLPDGSGIALLRELRGARLGPRPGAVRHRRPLHRPRRPGRRRPRLPGHRLLRRPPAAAPAAPHTLAARPRAARLTGAEALSGREVEVLQLVADGRSNKEIGEALGLSALTVKSHLARIARKLGTGDRAEMVVVAMRAGVVV